MLVHFEDTLDNMGLTEAWLEWDSNCVTQIENKYVKCESNWIDKTIESNQIGEKKLSLIKSRIEIRTGSKAVTSETSDAYDGARGGGSDASMDRLVIRRCASCDCDGGGDAGL